MHTDWMHEKRDYDGIILLGKANNESNFVYLLNYYVTNVAQAYQSEVNFNSDDTAIQVFLDTLFQLSVVRCLPGAINSL